ncbi:MAG: NADH-quinone oxidoreductase subunit J [Betaproteobacteria bacterium]|jgi:NADH-quinone oxidoreductase subunit J|nr:NADH-quinone oxidoreductase subunit J [Betaproteobacteria bacterium]MBK8318778.1 NADH-quinone oxidoreductase subunit J [Betaproteobacteria bacterium]MBK9782931.1 NADH-quinone oxidoreductase subunit J [Candidatus Dechloromonas phosphorivorans]MBK9784719.1 NADH-quinone oxidoreductase subunit J [Candidatus Dechloromonas phosphorivorans]
MDFQTFVFYFLSAILIAASLRVITARNPVHAALHLILAFFTCGGIWSLLQAEFLAIAIILVYVGAVMVLFLFVVMMLDINIDRVREGFWNYLPLGALLGILMVIEMGMVLGSKYLQVPATDVMTAGGVSNTKSIGALMFSDYVYPFELASIVLLVGMIAAIVLTYRGPKKTKYTNPNQQVFVKAKDRVRVLQMPVEKD